MVASPHPVAEPAASTHVVTRAPAIFASAFYPHVGGVEELVRQLANEQISRGMRPLVLTNRYPSWLPTHELLGDIEVSRHHFRAPAVERRQLSEWLALSGVGHLRVARQLRARGTDLIHVQCVSGNASYALSASRMLKLPLVVTMQGELTMDAQHIYERSSWLRHVWRTCLDHADLITACSRYVLDEAEAVYGRSFGDRGLVIPNGVRLAEYAGGATPADPPYVLGIGRMVEQKGFDLLIKAFARLKDDHPDVRLKLAGGGTALPALKTLVGELRLGDRVDFLGSVPHDRAIELFQQAAVFVLPSRHEPQGIVVLEAMASGTPVVAAAVGGVPEVVRDGENGLLFTGGDVGGIASVVSKVLADDGLIRQVVAGGVRTAAAHDWGEITDAYLAAYARAGR